MRPAGLARFASLFVRHHPPESLPDSGVPFGNGRYFYTSRRLRMVHEQLQEITDSGVLEAMAAVPRHEFVPQELRSMAYDDGALPIGYGQTISQPYIVAFMTAAIEPSATDRVLEIGTGSGYQTAVLARLVAEVCSMEKIEPLARRAAAALKMSGCKNIQLRIGDGHQGWPEAAPFDAVIVTCAPEVTPPALIAQLKPGGRMIIPVGPAGAQQLVLLRKHGEALEQQAILPVRFVPMTSNTPF